MAEPQNQLGIDPYVLANIVSQAVVSSLELILSPNVDGQNQGKNTEQRNDVVQNNAHNQQGVEQNTIVVPDNDAHEYSQNLATYIPMLESFNKKKPKSFNGHGGLEAAKN